MTKDELIAELVIERFAPIWKPEPPADAWLDLLTLAGGEETEDEATVYDFPVRAA